MASSASTAQTVRPCIEIDGLTHDFGAGRGIFDVSLSVMPGEVFGFAGVNGAGKTTTIRHLMGFMKPQAGSARIGGLDCWRASDQVKRRVAYVPGEIEFPADRTGTEFLRHQLELSGCDAGAATARARELCDRFQLDAAAPLKRMSKGMKQKTALVAAFALDAEVLVMDEPTTGLDPLMRDVFLDLVREQRAAGRTVFMSSHIFSEMEGVCDRVALIREGRIAAVTSMDEIRHGRVKTFEVTVAGAGDAARIQASGACQVLADADANAAPGAGGTAAGAGAGARGEAAALEPGTVPATLTVQVDDADIDAFTRLLSTCDVRGFTERKRTLDTYFHSIFREGDSHVQR